MQRNFIYKLANELADELSNLANLLTKPEKLAGIFSKTVQEGEKLLTEAEAKERSKKNIWKTIAFLGAPSAYMIGRVQGKKKQLEEMLNPPQQNKYGSYIDLLKLSSLFLHRLSDEHKMLNDKVKEYEKREQAVKIAMNMIEKGVIGPAQFSSKVEELIKKGNLESVIVAEKANNDIQLSGSESAIEESTDNGINSYTNFLLGGKE
jgi:hypothetical protein